MSSEEEPKLAVTGVVTGDATPMSEQKKQGAKCCEYLNYACAIIYVFAIDVVGAIDSIRWPVLSVPSVRFPIDPKFLSLSLSLSPLLPAYTSWLFLVALPLSFCD